MSEITQYRSREKKRERMKENEEQKSTEHVITPGHPLRYPPTVTKAIRHKASLTTMAAGLWGLSMPFLNRLRNLYLNEKREASDSADQTDVHYIYLWCCEFKSGLKKKNNWSQNSDCTLNIIRSEQALGVDDGNCATYVWFYSEQHIYMLKKQTLWENALVCCLVW